jgi:hypothetical protein
MFPPLLLSSFNKVCSLLSSSLPSKSGRPCFNGVNSKTSHSESPNNFRFSRNFFREHFWQVWLISVQRFQRRRFKCEKLTDGRTITHDKSSHGLWPGELKIRQSETRVAANWIVTLQEWSLGGPVLKLWIVCRSEIQDGRHDST